MPSNTPTPDKPALRQAIKSRLAMISPEERTSAAERVAGYLLENAMVREATTILAYASLPSELDLDPFIVSALAAGKRVCVPAVDWEAKAMSPVEIRNLDEDLRSGRYGVRAPKPGCPSVHTEEIDLVILPGLAFDRANRRLGRGAGFYDRMIASMHQSGHRPRLIGVCYAVQVIDRVPTDPHDLPVDLVITEQGRAGSV